MSLRNDFARKVLKSILKESVNGQKVMNAITRKKEVKILYNANDGNPRGKKLRVIQPVAYGLSKSGNEIVRAFQILGDTETRRPQWKTFRLDRVDKWVTTRKTFQEPPQNQWGSFGKFNPNGDGSMAEVYKIADFNNSEKLYNNSGLKQYNQARYDNAPVGQELRNKLKYNKTYNAKDFDYVQRNVDSWQKPENFDSIWDMAQVSDFGDDGKIESEGPVTKDDTPLNLSQEKLDYTNAIKNGPILKRKK